MAGNPNVGKSALFNRLTGANAVVSNYPGTTVDYTSGSIIVSGRKYVIIDLPGAYSLDPRDGAEEVAVKILDKYPDAIVMVVLDATRIERGLYLLLEILERGYSLIVAVNMIDAAHDKEVSVDTGMMQKILGVPVVATSAISGEGVKDLVEMVAKARHSSMDEIEAKARGDFRETPARCGCGGCGGCGL